MTERKTGFLLMEKMEFGKQAEGLAKATIRILPSLTDKSLKTSVPPVNTDIIF